MRDDRHLIRCPHCGAEYAPSEIFYPSDFLPDAIDVTKDADGRIVAYEGSLMNLSEEYECDRCGHVFRATADVSFGSEPCEAHDFGSDYAQRVYPTAVHELGEPDDSHIGD